MDRLIAFFFASYITCPSLKRSPTPKDTQGAAMRRRPREEMQPSSSLDTSSMKASWASACSPSLNSSQRWVKLYPDPRSNQMTYLPGALGSAIFESRFIPMYPVPRNGTKTWNGPTVIDSSLPWLITIWYVWFILIHRKLLHLPSIIPSNLKHKYNKYFMN